MRACTKPASSVRRLEIGSPLDPVSSAESDRGSRPKKRANYDNTGVRTATISGVGDGGVALEGPAEARTVGAVERIAGQLGFIVGDWAFRQDCQRGEGRCVDRSGHGGHGWRMPPPGRSRPAHPVSQSLGCADATVADVLRTTTVTVACRVGPLPFDLGSSR